jgi:hypothetical protein
MNVSSVKNLNGETFSAVQDADLTTVVQTNSATWGQGGGGSTSGLVSGTNVVKVPDWEGDNFGDYWSACISGDVKVATGDYDEDGLYEHSVYSLSAIGSDIGNKLNKNTIENSKTIRSNNNVYEVFDFAYKRTNFTNGSASNIDLNDNASIEFDADEVVRPSKLYSATIIAETTATGEIETENGGIWKIADFSNGSAILTATYLAGIRSDIIDLYTWEGWGPITNCEATCTVYTSAELSQLAFKDDIPSVPGYNETVLWSGSLSWGQTAALSDSVKNYDRIRFYVEDSNRHRKATNELVLTDLSNTNLREFALNMQDATISYFGNYFTVYDINEVGDSLTSVSGRQWWYAPWTATNINGSPDRGLILTRVIGINRISANNA